MLVASPELPMSPALTFTKGTSTMLFSLRSMKQIQGSVFFESHPAYACPFAFFHFVAGFNESRSRSICGHIPHRERSHTLVSSVAPRKCRHRRPEETSCPATVCFF